MQNIPQKIFLQVDADGEDLTNVDFKELEVTWSSDKIHDTDIPYIREPENGGWISVETPPTEKDTDKYGGVLACNVNGLIISIIWNLINRDESITHWQPLPQPPIK